jgi:uncharacterized secreted protein with C-terminal beta-propeller domain
MEEAAIRRTTTWVSQRLAKAKAECSGNPLGEDACLNLGSRYGYDLGCDDPLRASGYGPGDATIRVRPGPVRMGGVGSPSLSTAPLRDFAEQVSSTNVQVAGVDEPDIVKNDARYVYLAEGSAVAIVEAWPPNAARVVARVPVEGTVLRMFLADERLVVFSSLDRPSGYRTKVTVFTLADKRPLRELFMSGSFVGARRIGAAVHAVVVERLSPEDKIQWNEPPGICRPDLDEVYEDLRRDMVRAIRSTSFEDLLPTLEEVSYDGGRRTTTGRMLGCNRYGDEGSAPGTQTSIVSFDLRGGHASMITTLTEPGILYASPTSLYLTRPPRHDRLESHPSLRDAAAGTPIDTFSLRGAEARYTGSAMVVGEPLNQFAMDEHDGRLRVATLASLPRGRSTALTVLRKGSGSPAIEGWIDRVAPNEDIRAVRFVRDRAYVVTFRRVDPLFVFDLAGGRPKLLGELTIPGFSTYIHPIDDHHLLTIGLDTQEAKGAVQTGGVRLQIVDVGTPLQPKLRHLEILAEKSSEALHDHLAFTYVGAPRDLLVLPVGSSQTTAPGLVVYGASVAGGFRLLGKPTPTGPGPVRRTLVMDDYVVAVSQGWLETWHLPELSRSVARVRLSP